MVIKGEFDQMWRLVNTAEDEVVVWKKRKLARARESPLYTLGERATARDAMNHLTHPALTGSSQER